MVYIHIGGIEGPLLPVTTSYIFLVFDLFNVLRSIPVFSMLCFCFSRLLFWIWRHDIARSGVRRPASGGMVSDGVMMSAHVPRSVVIRYATCNRPAIRGALIHPAIRPLFFPAGGRGEGGFFHGLGAGACFHYLCQIFTKIF